MVTLVTVATGLAVAPSTASAAEVPITDATLEWAVSTYVGTSSSLTPERAAGAPATVDADGWTFTGGTGTYDPATGVTHLEFAGAMEMGNIIQGNYGFLLSNPVIDVDEDGSGTVSADVATRGPGGPPGVKSTFRDPVEDVVIVTFTGTGDDESGTVSWDVTPDTEDVTASPAFDGAQQFPQGFLDVLGAGLAGHFRQTDPAGAEADANINKLPAPISFSLTYEAEEPGDPTGPRVTVTPYEGLDPAGDTVTVSGSGFEGVGVYVRLCAAVDGEIGTAAGRPGAADCDESALWIGNPMMGAPIAMGADGTFNEELDVSATLVNDAGTIDCLEVACGIAVRRDHIGGGSDYSYDAFVPVSFQGEDPGGEDPGGEDPGGEDPGTDPGEPPVSGTIVGGELEWGVKDSFRSYIVGPIAQGNITTQAPASQEPGNGTFHFPLAEEGTFESVDAIDAGFTGGVRLYGHEGAMDVTISDLQVTIDGDEGSLIGDVVANEKDTDNQYDVDDVVIAELDLSGVQATADGSTVTVAGVPATLTEDGEVAFSGFYHAGDPLDPVTLVLEVEGADLGGLPGADPDADKVGCVPESVVAGGDIQVCGGGFVPGEQVQVILHSTPVTLAVVTADAGGDVQATVTIPSTTEAGTHHIELLGITSGRSITSAPFQVLAGQTTALPRTGTDAGQLVALSVALMLAGSILVRRTRREVL